MGDRLAAWSLALYLPMAAAGCLWRVLGLGLPAVPLAGRADILWAAVGAALAGVVVGGSVLLRRHFAFARRMERAFRSVLGSLSWSACFVLAASSAVGEELLFRGALQTALSVLCRSEVWGLVFASLLFGAAHVPPVRELRAWGPFAAVMGFVFGGLYLASGSVVAPTVCHFGINFINLHRIAGDDRLVPVVEAGPRGARRGEDRGGAEDPEEG